MEPVHWLDSYEQARDAFRTLADRLGWSLERCAFPVRSARGEELTLDAAISPAPQATVGLVVSSGLHGVEGPLGSAVQTLALQNWLRNPAAANVRCVFLHALNPFGWAWHRRFDEGNVDPNRNFLLPGEEFSGAPPGYKQLDPLLNPRHARTWSPFVPQALWAVARQGLPALKQAIAGGQYDFPQGLFFGGHGPSYLQQLLLRQMPRWLQGLRRVVHLDFHTGLGRWGQCKLLIEAPLTEAQRDRLTRWYGVDAFEACDSQGVAYRARGGIGLWCAAQGFAEDYLYACAEYGTYGPLRVLAGLRAENQCFHWGDAHSRAALRAKRRLRELFCPASPKWRRQTALHGAGLVERAIVGLAEENAPTN